MTDDLKKRGPQDRVRINTHEEHEVRYWMKKLGVSDEQLRRAVSEVGPSADEVAKFLNRSLYVED
jgi:hypothetical protein